MWLGEDVQYGDPVRAAAGGACMARWDGIDHEDVPDWVFLSMGPHSPQVWAETLALLTAAAAHPGSWTPDTPEQRRDQAETMASVGRMQTIYN